MSAAPRIRNLQLPFDLETFRAQYPEPDPRVGEVLQDQEPEAAFRIASTILRNLARQYGISGDPKVRRDAHPKSHGCVAVEFRVRPDLPPHLAKGAFRPGAVYRGLARFSNTSEAPKPDTAGDGRGMAIKLLDVPDEGMADGTRSMDFLTVTHPQFMLARVSAYVLVIRLLQGRRDLSKLLAIPGALLGMGISGAPQLARFVTAHTSSVFTSAYHSMVAYRLGGPDDPEARPVKYRALPPRIDHAVPAGAGPDYLRETLAATLAEGPVEMRFQVQQLPPQGTLPLSEQWEHWVEDPRRAWPEDRFPFETVATLHFPRQTLDFSAPDAFGDDLSFNPWRTLAAHRPIGAVNRVRLGVYNQVSAWRRRINGVSLDEPEAPPGV